MEKEQLISYLKSIKRSASAINRTLWALDAFEHWLKENHDLTIDADIQMDHLEAFIHTAEKRQKNLCLGLINVFDFQGKEALQHATAKMRGSSLKKESKPMRLKDFLGVDETLIAGLGAKGIKDAWQLLKLCRTIESRKTLAAELGVPYQDLLTLVKMADLSRMFAVKAVRTRLYLDSGFDTLDKLSAQNPMDLHLALTKYVEESHFHGIATLPKEAKFTVKEAQKIERWIAFEEDE
jgi:hypothetical protein